MFSWYEIKLGHFLRNSKTLLSMGFGIKQGGPVTSIVFLLVLSAGDKNISPAHREEKI